MSLVLRHFGAFSDLEWVADLCHEPGSVIGIIAHKLSREPQLIGWVHIAMLSFDKGSS